MGSEHDALGPPKVVNIEDLRRLPRRRLPQPVFDYLDGGAEDEITLRENSRALQDISFRPRGAIAIKKCDIVKAICLGARAVLIGRAYAYGLGAARKAGVTRAREILRANIERTLRLLGCPSVAALDRSFVEVPHTWECQRG